MRCESETATGQQYRTIDHTVMRKANTNQLLNVIPEITNTHLVVKIDWRRPAQHNLGRPSQVYMYRRIVPPDEYRRTITHKKNNSYMNQLGLQNKKILRARVGQLYIFIFD